MCTGLQSSIIRFAFVPIPIFFTLPIITAQQRHVHRYVFMPATAHHPLTTVIQLIHTMTGVARITAFFFPSVHAIVFTVVLTLSRVPIPFILVIVSFLYSNNVSDF